MLVEVLTGELRRPARLGDVGHDLVVSEDTDVSPGGVVYVPTGVSLRMHGCYARIVPRSSATKSGLIICEGTIDEAYTGLLYAAVMGHSVRRIRRGERICQLVFCPVILPDLIGATGDTDTAHRGELGFGSTG